MSVAFPENLSKDNLRFAGIRPPRGNGGVKSSIIALPQRRRGGWREAIYEDDAEHERFLDVLGQEVSDFNWLVHACCLMTNQCHLVVETPDGNLSKGMRQLNGVFTQYSNRRYRRTGHLFQLVGRSSASRSW